MNVSITAKDGLQLRDENEQLRTALESALEQNAGLIEDCDRLRGRVGDLARELQAFDANITAQKTVTESAGAHATRQSQTEEELRVAFEELQVLTEELEVANSSLHQTNQELDLRVERRTQQYRAANSALRTTEALFQTVVDLVPDILWRCDHDGEATWFNRRWFELTGQDGADPVGALWFDAVHPDERAAVEAAWRKAIADREPYEQEQRLRGSGGQYRWFLVRAAPMQDGAGAIVHWFAAGTDVDDILDLRNEQSVLVGELQHRTRNLMAVVHAVTMRTITGASSLEDFRASIDDRLRALARVQGLLSRRDAGARVSFDALLREELAAHGALGTDGDGRHVSLDGPRGVTLRSSMVQMLALALHELATNAVKYGALSGRGGSLDVSWRVLSDGTAAPRLVVEWRESGIDDMPGVQDMPRGGGYGRELIEQALPFQLGARTTYDLKPDGVHCTIEVAVPPTDNRMETVDA